MRQKAEQISQPLYYDGLDTHPTPKGYGTIAELVAVFLRAEGLIPQSPSGRRLSAYDAGGISNQSARRAP